MALPRIASWGLDGASTCQRWYCSSSLCRELSKVPAVDLCLGKRTFIVPGMGMPWTGLCMCAYVCGSILFPDNSVELARLTGEWSQRMIQRYASDPRPLSRALVSSCVLDAVTGELPSASWTTTSRSRMQQAMQWLYRERINVWPASPVLSPRPVAWRYSSLLYQASARGQSKSVCGSACSDKAN
jgi:hypothetical protein